MARAGLAGRLRASSKDIPIGQIRGDKVYPFVAGEPSKVPTHYVRGGKVFEITIGGLINGKGFVGSKPVPIGRVGRDGQAYLNKY